ncbi:MAG: hypothetical protein Q4B50_06415 [Bacillota bacterium]|nr:hypothetical protein [Bacillota bacterium]
MKKLSLLLLTLLSLSLCLLAACGNVGKAQPETPPVPPKPVEVENPFLEEEETVEKNSFQEETSTGESSSGPQENEEEQPLEQEENKPSAHKGFTSVPADFSLLIHGSKLFLGRQEGSFPWGMELEKESTQFWSSDGFDNFSITCTDGTILRGLCQDGAKDEKDGLLIGIYTENPVYQCNRGSYVGMSREDFLHLYPDVMAIENSGPNEDYYSYTIEGEGFLQILFCFVEDQLHSIAIVNGIDGYLNNSYL